MYLLARLLRRKAGRTPYRLDELTGVDVDPVVRLLARNLVSVQRRLEIMEGEHRRLVGRIDEGLGLPNSTEGTARVRNGSVS